jgi:thymidylate synthase
MNDYSDLVKRIKDSGSWKWDRTGTGTLSVFGAQMRFNLQDGFPLLTLKRTFWKGVVSELFWMLSGSTNAYDLPETVQKWWTPWADGDGSLGPTYGKQFRDSGGVDQLQGVIQSLKEDPDSRRHNISLWNPGEIGAMNLPPCHGNLIQFYVGQDKKLSCHMTQRSGDMFLGVPVNIAFYSLLTHLIAKECGYGVGEFIHSIGDAHIYRNHVDQCEEMLKREHKELPTLTIGSLPGDSLLWFIDEEYKNMSYKEVSKVVTLDGYNPHPRIKGEVAI